MFWPPLVLIARGPEGPHLRRFSMIDLSMPPPAGDELPAHPGLRISLRFGKALSSVASASAADRRWTLASGREVEWSVPSFPALHLSQLTLGYERSGSVRESGSPIYVGMQVHPFGRDSR
jgi:hypothetical protein